MEKFILKIKKLKIKLRKMPELIQKMMILILIRGIYSFS